MKPLQIIILTVSVTALTVFIVAASRSNSESESSKTDVKTTLSAVNFAAIPTDKFGDEVRYGRELMLRTAYYIGPEGIKGKYLGNKMNCTNCHQDGGTKPYSFNLMLSHDNYPQYRAREGRVLSLADRINNCIERPHNGKPLPFDSREMVALLSYLKWINGFVPEKTVPNGAKNLDLAFPDNAASSARGAKLYNENCQRCHGSNGEGKLDANNESFLYPPLWGNQSYQSGSSMHRVIKQAQWLKANMPFDKSKWQTPFLSDQQVLDLAAFINDDPIHTRPVSHGIEYPHAEEKAIDYGHAPFADTFSIAQHLRGPFKPIIEYWKKTGLKPNY